MSKLYGSIKGNRGEATRCGSNSFQGHIRGWHSGVKVQAHINDNGDAVFDVYMTSGSTGAKPDILIGTVVDGVFSSADKQKKAA